MIDQPPAKSPTHPYIEVRSLGKAYPNGFRALDNVNVSINKGEFVVIIGSSGAGKSTFIRSLNGLVTPTNGSILINGRNMITSKGTAKNRVRSRAGLH